MPCAHAACSQLEYFRSSNLNKQSGLYISDGMSAAHGMGLIVCLQYSSSGADDNILCAGNQACMDGAVRSDAWYPGLTG